MNAKAILHLAKKALVLKKSWGRGGKKGWYKKLASRAERAYGKAQCQES